MSKTLSTSDLEKIQEDIDAVFRVLCALKKDIDSLDASYDALHAYACRLQARLIGYE